VVAGVALTEDQAPESAGPFWTEKLYRLFDRHHGMIL
jgi:hypothetical protein